MDNANTKDYLDKIRTQVVENLKRTAFAPSVQMTEVPRNPMLDGMDDEADDVLDDLDEDENKDKRFTQRRFDQYVEKPGELSDSEDEEENAANGVRRQPNALRRRNQANYRNLGATDSGLESGMATPQDASSVGDGDLDGGLDIKMTDAPRTDPDVPAAAVAAPDTATATPTTDADQLVAEGEETGPSVAASQQPSPRPHDEDTAMEDAGAAVPVADQSENITELKSENEPEASLGVEEPNSPDRPFWYLNPATDSLPAAETSAQKSAPTDASETAKQATAESTEESNKEE